MAGRRLLSREVAKFGKLDSRWATGGFRSKLPGVGCFESRSWVLEIACFDCLTSFAGMVKLERDEVQGSLVMGSD